MSSLRTAGLFHSSQCDILWNKRDNRPYFHRLTDSFIRLWHKSGWPDVIAVVLASLAGSVLLAIIVEKSKKCLDFGVTLFLIHLFACALYDGIPTVMDWWIVHVFGMIVMVLLGEYLCSRKELDDIPLLTI
jgi:protein SYS1